MPSNTINSDSAVTGLNRATASLAIAVALLLHCGLIWLLFEKTIIIAVPPRVMSVTLVRLPVPVPAKAKHVPVPVPVSVPVPVKPMHVPARLVIPPVIHHARVAIRSPPRLAVRQPPHHVPRLAAPELHFAGGDTDTGLGLNLAPPASGSGNGSIGPFNDAVKQRIEAAKTYPPALKGMWNECVVSYRVTVDHTGQLLSYKLYGCGNPFLDSAARAAILTASPFPVPPDFGGDAYDVYGSLIFKQK